MLGKRPRDAQDIDTPEQNDVYYFEHGLRFVKPYEHHFTCFAKRRWIGQLLVEVYSNEFKAFCKDYYINAVEHWKNKENEGTHIKGKITVNTKNIDLNYRIKDGDQIMHSTVREETPIYDKKPKIIRSTDDYLVVDKPSSIPVHACGNFKLNTLQSILEIEMNYVDPTEANKDAKGSIKTVHRLDRQTSGIVFFAKNEAASDRFRKLMLGNQISKVYFARVFGDFSKCNGYDADTRTLKLRNFIYCVSNIDAFWECAEQEDIAFEYRTKAKEAITNFKFKFYDPETDMSVIKCYPETGRTHQIRVHLKKLGYPIANDQMYGFKDRCILNDGEEPLPEDLFKNSYQNDEEGKKNFLKLWLHAYRYKVPMGQGFDDKNTTSE